MYVVDRKRFLALDFVDSSDNESTISYFKTEREVVRAWQAHTRISPVWPLVSDKSKRKSHIDKLPKDCFLFFAGPVNPENLDVQFGPNFNEAFPNSTVWGSLGILNLIVSTTSDEENDLLREFFKDLKVVCEIWTLADGEILEVDVPQPINASPTPEISLTKSTGKTQFSTVIGKELEMAATALTASRRGGVYFPWVHSEVDGIVVAYGDIVESFSDSDGKIDLKHEAELVYALANINSGLSRFTSQALSGTAPIRISECHFWPHSFLGTGLCNLVMRNFIAFVENSLGKYNLVERFKGLSDFPSHKQPPLLNDFESLERDLLAASKPLRDDPTVTPISYFSGRDNFKNDVFTVSAPLDTISGLNSKKWSILTVTHELSHRFVEPILAELMPKSAEEVRCGRSNKPKYSRFSDPTTYFDIAQRDFLQCALLYAGSQGFDIDKAREDEDNLLWVVDLLKRYNLQLEEIFVHAFDFLYFYGRSVERYVPDIWNSWGVLPQVEGKLDEYIVRTAAALLSNKASVKDNPVEIVRRDILKFLPSETDNPSAHIVEARRRITDENYWTQKLVERCEAADMAGRFVLQYLHSEGAMSALGGDDVVRTTDKSFDYSASDLKLDTRSFDNPISFLSAFATDRDPDETKSVWLFLMMAFALDIEKGG